MPAKRRGRGEGNVEELPSGKYRAVLSLGRDPVTKKRRKATHTADTKREVLAWMRDQQDKLAKGTLPTAGKLTVADWLTEWLAAKKATVEGGTAGFYDGLVPLVRDYLGAVPLARLSGRDVAAWHARLTADGHSADRQRKASTMLRTMLNAAVDAGLIPNSPARKVKKPKAARKEMDVFDVDQARRFLAAAAGYRLEAYYVLALDSGMRPQELLALQWPDIDWAGQTVTVQRALVAEKGGFRLKPPKSKAGVRTIKLTPKTMAALRAHRERMKEEGQDVDRGTIFVTRAGGYQSQPTLYRRSFLPILKKAGLPQVRPYTLRHTSATLLLSRDVNVLVVSKRLGHEDIATTLRFYGHALNTMQEKAAEAMADILGGDSPTSVPPKSGLSNPVVAVSA